MSCDHKKCSCDCKKTERPCYETLPTKVKRCDPIIHPTKHRVVEQTEVVIIPEVYPTHTTYVNNQVVRREYSFPQTESVEERTEYESVVENGNGNNGGGYYGGRRRGWSWI
ncbi:spore coat protein [Shouchella clausii]|uniref:spore coat protein n=1 Tax=Shouchella clausii TaxID=79880 RepID=UPI00280A65BF|nr:spore coat protein [Shouchella clausii]WMM30787.1 spore coat protein [Shouchella clausii]